MSSSSGGSNFFGASSTIFTGFSFGSVIVSGRRSIFGGGAALLLDGLAGLLVGLLRLSAWLGHAD